MELPWDIKMKTKVTIEDHMGYYRVSIKGNSLYRWLGFIIGGTAASLIVTRIWPGPDFMSWQSFLVRIGGYLAGSIIGSLISREWKDEPLGNISCQSAKTDELFFDFLEKFAEKEMGTRIKEWLLPWVRKKFWGKWWKIKYDLLLSAIGLLSVNPEAFKEAVGKAKSKKEFLWLAEIR